MDIYHYLSLFIYTIKPIIIIVIIVMLINSMLGHLHPSGPPYRPCRWEQLMLHPQSLVLSASLNTRRPQTSIMMILNIIAINST